MPRWLDKLLGWLSGRKAKPAPPPPDVADVEETFLWLHNRHRERLGLSFLTLHAGCTRAAVDHAAIMARSLLLKHRVPGEPEFQVRMSIAGVAWRACGENVAAGYPTPAAVVDAWVGDRRHRQTLLGPWSVVGFGWTVGADGHAYVCADYAALPADTRAEANVVLLPGGVDGRPWDGGVP